MAAGNLSGIAITKGVSARIGGGEAAPSADAVELDSPRERADVELTISQKMQ